MGSMRSLASAAALLCAACVTSPRLPIPAGATVRRLATDMGFTEGPVWLEDRGAVVFSDIPNARLMLWSETDGLSELRASENANGNALDPDGRLLSCQHGARNIVREEADGSLSVVIDRFMGKRFNSPNDVAVQSDGVLWFTDPPWGLPEQREGKELPGHWVFRFDERRGDLRLALNDLAMPNGIALSPDESRLYVADTGGHSSHPDPRVRGVPATLSAYALEDGEMVSTKPVWRVEARCDGMCVDVKGNVYATGDGAVTIWSPDGDPVGEIPIPEVPANCCFGGPRGRTLFVTARTSLYAIDLRYAGAGL